MLSASLNKTFPSSLHIGTVFVIDIILITRKEDNVLFNDVLNTFYLRLYGVRHMVKDHSDSERGNPLPPHGLLFPIRGTGNDINVSMNGSDTPVTRPETDKAGQSSRDRFRLADRILLYTPSHRQDTTAFVTPVVEHWLEREITHWVDQ